MSIGTLNVICFLAEILSTAEKIIRVYGKGNDLKSGKTVNIHGKIYREQPVGND